MHGSHAGVVAGQRYSVGAVGGALLSRAADRDPGESRRLAQGRTVVCAEVASSADGSVRARIAAPQGWVDASALHAPPPLPAMLDYTNFAARQHYPAPGDHHGLLLPGNMEALQAAGPEFLTAAFRAAGTIAPDNQVIRIVALDPLDVRGASDNALLTVAYARDEPGLDTDLFVKFPAADTMHAFRQLHFPNGEIEMMRLSQRQALPFPVAKCYFADCCADTSAYLLITQRIAFGQGGLEPAHRKGYDHLVSDPPAHYDALVSALASLAAAHRTGALGDEVEDMLPFARATRDYVTVGDSAPQVDKLVRFVGTTAPQLFAQQVRDRDFMARWRDDLLFGLTHREALVQHLLADVDYTALCHPNLNIDNAWYWRDDGGRLHAGLLDWGGAGQMPIAQALSGMLMMPEPDAHLGLVHRMIDRFVTDYAAHGGPVLDRETLHRQYKASLYSTAISLFVSILADIVDGLPEELCRSFTDLNDPRLAETGLRSAIVWIDNVLREWTEPLTPGMVARAIVAGGA